MFVIEGREAKAEMRDQDEIDALVQHLQGQGYRAVLRSMLGAACDVATVDAGSVGVADLLSDRASYRRLQSSLMGDVFFLQERAYFLQPQGSRLQALGIRHHGIKPEIDTFCEKVAASAHATLDGRRLRGMDFQWQPTVERSRRDIRRRRLYPEVKLETRDPDYSPQESEWARLLAAREQREFVLRLAQVGSRARAVDTASEAGEVVTQPLLDCGLIHKEYLVLCRQDSHTICAVRDRDKIASGTGTRFRCTICGRPFCEELIEEIFALTGDGKTLLDGSRWMMIWVTDLLIAAGIGRDRISWNAVAGDDELDIITDVLGSKVFFELKDRDFRLGDAYPFALRVERYGGDGGVVVCTETIDNEAKRFFNEERPTAQRARVDLVEGQVDTEEQLAALVDRWSRIAVIQRLASLSEPVAVNLVPVLQTWMNSNCGQ